MPVQDNTIYQLTILPVLPIKYMSFQFTVFGFPTNIFNQHTGNTVLAIYLFTNLIQLTKIDDK